MPVCLTSRFIARFSKKSSGQEERLPMFEKFLEKTDFETYKSEGFSFYFQTEGQSHLKTKGLSVLDIFKGTRLSERTFDFIESAAFPAADWQSVHSYLENEAQFYNFIEVRPKHFRLESDRLGLKPVYILETQESTWLASSTKDLLAIFPEFSRPLDPVTLYGVLSGNQILSEKTLYKKIRRLMSGASVEWSVADGLVITPVRKILFPKVNASISEKTAINDILDVYERSLKERIRHAKGPLMLALSGGFDSRLIGCMLKKFAIPFKCYTYGERHFHEARIASKITKILKTEHVLLPYPPNNMIEKADLGLSILEGHGANGCLPIANLFQKDIPQGTGLLHGFLAGFLSGANLKYLPAPALTDFKHLSEGVLKAFMNQPVERDCFEGIDLDPEEFMREIENTLSKSCEPYQSFILWDLEHRQRRVIGCHIDFLGSFYDVLAPSYDMATINAWLRLPLVALENQSLLRRIFASRYPEMAKIPHAAEEHPILPNLSTQLPLFFDRALRHHIPRLVLGEKGYRRWRSPNIEFLWSGLTPAQRSYMLAVITENRDFMRKAFGISPSEKFNQTEKLSNFTIQNTFMLSKLAKDYADRKDLHESCSANEVLV